MLYFTLPTDLRDRYENSEWLSFAEQVEQTSFTPEDVVVFSAWLTKTSSERVQLVLHIRRQGARVIYVGPKSEETDDLKRQLCLMGVYDFVFFADDIVLGEVERFIDHPRTPADVREYLGDDAVGGLSVPDVVDIEEDAKPSELDVGAGAEERSGFSRRRWGRSRGRRETPEPVVQLIQPRLIAVVGLWPRSGVSTVAQLVAKRFTEPMPPNTVSLVEHPNQWARMWEYFQLDERQSAKEYVHWTEDGIGMTVEVEGVSLVPLPPGNGARGRGWESKMMPYLMRQLRRPITVIDCGQNVQEDLLFHMVDRLVCVVDCDPTYLSIEELGQRYESLVTKYRDRMVTVLNKWTRFTHYEDVFEDAIRVPYLPPEDVQKALWAGRFLDMDDKDILEGLEAFQEALVDPLLPSK